MKVLETSARVASREADSFNVHLDLLPSFSRKCDACDLSGFFAHVFLQTLAINFESGAVVSSDFNCTMRKYFYDGEWS